MKFLSPDSKFMEGWTNLTDAIWVNILMIVTSLPIVTVGAALSAGQTALRKSQSGQGTVTRNYFAAFRENFAKSTLLWLIFGVTGAGLIYLWIVLQITPLLVPKIAFSIVWLIGFEWSFYLQARFENTLGGTLRNAYIFGVVYFPATLAMVAIDALFIALLVGAWFVMPQGLFLLVVLGYGCMLALHVPILEYALRKYTRADSATEPANEAQPTPPAQSASSGEYFTRDQLPRK